MDQLDMQRLRAALETARTLEGKARDLGAYILGDRLEVAVDYLMDAVDAMTPELVDAP